jgi:hypothetical protein
MNRHQAFLLRLPEPERERAKRLARELGLSENRLYAELIHDGLLMQEQRLYMNRLREQGRTISREHALDMLDKVPDTPPEPYDA